MSQQPLVCAFGERRVRVGGKGYVKLHTHPDQEPDRPHSSSYLDKGPCGLGYQLQGQIYENHA